MISGDAQTRYSMTISGMVMILTMVVYINGAGIDRFLIVKCCASCTTVVAEGVITAIRLINRIVFPSFTIEAIGRYFKSSSMTNGVTTIFRIVIRQILEWLKMSFQFTSVMVIPSIIIHTGPRVAEIWLMVFPRITGSLICAKNRIIPRMIAIRLILQRIFFQLCQLSPPSVTVRESTSESSVHLKMHWHKLPTPHQGLRLQVGSPDFPELEQMMDSFSTTLNFSGFADDPDKYQQKNMDQNSCCYCQKETIADASGIFNLESVDHHTGHDNVNTDD